MGDGGGRGVFKLLLGMRNKNDRSQKPSLNECFTEPSASAACDEEYRQMCNVMSRIWPSTAYRVYAENERRVSFHHGRRVFDDVPQSVHVQVEDHGHEQCSHREYRRTRQVYSCIQTIKKFSYYL